MTLVDHAGTQLKLEPYEGEHTALLSVDGGVFALRPDSAAALAGVLLAWVAERSKDVLF